MPLLCIGILCLEKRSLISIKLLSYKPLVYLGLASYSIYLYHQPLLAFARLKRINDIEKDKRPISYIDAIVHYCELNKIEVETTTRLISKSLKEKIKAEALDANLLKIKKGGTLPV